MYSQSRPYGNNLGESKDANFDQEWGQHKPKICDEEPTFIRGTEKNQNDIKASPKLQSFNYPYSSASLDRRIEDDTRNGYEYVCHSGENGSTDSSGNVNGLGSDNNHYDYVFGTFSSSDIYENDGDTFQTHSEFDRSSVILERSDGLLSDYKHQPLIDNITGGTFRKEYIDMNLYRPNLQHDSSISLQNARRIGCIENRSVETQTQNPYQNEKRNYKKINKTGLVVILVILLIACIAGVLAWFLAKKGDDEFSVKYYVVVSPIIAIYGETTTKTTCVFSPHGDWVHVTVTVENQGIPYVIGKYHSNKSFEEPDSLERFNVSISSIDTEIVVYMSLDLQAPTTDMCSWDGKYTFSCSITMIDTIPTRVFNGSQIFITAPTSDVTIDSFHYNEGDKMTFNCSSKGDPNHSMVYTELIKDSTVLQTILGRDFSSGYNDTYDNNCLVDLQWSGGSPNPLTTDQNHVIVRCVAKNTLLNESRTSEKMLNISVVDVAFETYKIESYIGSQVSVKCLARNTDSIKSILIRKIEILLNTTVANATLPDMTYHVDGTSVSYTNSSLTLTFSSLTCSDDGYYTCIVIKEDESQTESPAYLHVQLKNPPKHEEVILTINPDIKENDYVTSNVHTCSGDVGYPVGLGYLSLKFIDPITNSNFTYDKMSVTEDMKTTVNPPLKFKVNLATGLSLIIVEDKEPDDVNCTRNKEIKFLLQATSYWNKAKIRCSVISEVGEVNATAVEEEIYVIPDSICDGSNGSDVYRPHEKIDGCKTYVRCYNNVPTGILCQSKLCFDHQVDICDWCTPFMCQSELIPTTEELTTVTTTTSPAAVEVTQCPILSCNSTSVYDMEIAYIVCDMNASATYDNITVMKNEQRLMTAYPNRTNHYYSNGTNKYEGTLETSFTFTIKDVLCSDKNNYTFTVEDGGRVICSQTSLLDIKAKPTKPKLVIDYRWTEGTNVGTHSCTGYIGNPPGTMTLEIRNGETGNFTSFSPDTKKYSKKLEDCNNNATLNFSIDFNTESIQGYHIRCVADNQFTLSSSESPFYSDLVLIKPLPENACFSNGIKPYPGDCSRFLSCSYNNTNVLKCGAGSCFEGTLSTCVVNNCTSICTY